MVDTNSNQAINQGRQLYDQDNDEDDTLYGKHNDSLLLPKLKSSLNPQPILKQT